MYILIFFNFSKNTSSLDNLIHVETEILAESLVNTTFLTESVNNLIESKDNFLKKNELFKNVVNDLQLQFQVECDLNSLDVSFQPVAKSVSILTCGSQFGTLNATTNSYKNILLKDTLNRKTLRTFAPLTVSDSLTNTTSNFEPSELYPFTNLSYSSIVFEVINLFHNLMKKLNAKSVTAGFVERLVEFYWLYHSSIIGCIYLAYFKLKFFKFRFVKLQSCYKFKRVWAI